MYKVAVNRAAKVHLTVLVPTPPPMYPAGKSAVVGRPEVSTVKSGTEFKGLKRAGTALISSRGVKTLTFTLHSHTLLLHLLKNSMKGSSNSMQREIL